MKIRSSIYRWLLPVAAGLGGPVLRRARYNARQQTVGEQYVENFGAGRRLHLRHLLGAPLELRQKSGQRLLLGRTPRGRVHVGPFAALQRVGGARRDPEQTDGHHRVDRLVAALLRNRPGQRRAEVRAGSVDSDDRRQAQLGVGAGLFRPRLRLFLGCAPVGRRASQPAADRIGRSARDLSFPRAQGGRLCADRLRHRVGAGAFGCARLGQVSGHQDGRADAQGRVQPVDVCRAEGRRCLSRGCRGCTRGDRHLVVAAVRQVQPDLRPHGRQRQAREEQQGDRFRALQRPDRVQDGRLRLVFRAARACGGQSVSGQSRADTGDAVAHLRSGVPRQAPRQPATSGATPVWSGISATGITAPMGGRSSSAASSSAT